MTPEPDSTSSQVRAVGSAPGTLVVPEGAIPTRITVIRYGRTDFERRENVAPDALKKLTTGYAGVVWVDITGCGTLSVFEMLVRDFGLPWLALEDVLNAPQRPKVEPFGDARFIIVRQIQKRDTVEMDQISIWFKPGIVFTFQHHAGDCFDTIRKRLGEEASQLRQRGADYLAYRIVDSCVDSFFPEAERLMDALESLEQTALEKPDRRLLLQLHALKRELRVIEKTILPLRDAVGSLTRDDAAFAVETRPYLRDVHDHTNQLVEQTHLLDQLSGDVGDLALGSLDVKLNMVMKVLAAVTFVFMPISFITSFYGMNFQHMPELGWEWGYTGVIVLIIGLTVAIIGWLWKQGWTNLD